MAQWLDAEVVENYAWNQELFSVRVRTTPFEFVAGQFVRLGITTEDGRVQRAYSLVNGPDAEVLDFLVTRVEGGKLSPLLHHLQPGQTVQVSQPPSGFFTLNEVPDGDSLWLLSSGTGIGPYLSMLATDIPWQRFKRIHLVHAVRHTSDLAYRAQLEAWEQSHAKQFNYVPVVSREDCEGALRGRIPALIESGELEAAVGDQLTSDAQVMICGNPDMIKDAKVILDAKGLPKNLRRKPGNVTVEQYW
ncbi:ferredoxin--NADP+ reductase [Pseudidiomarina planktonica]|uniref:ferredoxin--NADP(+) reductase n=1 Tax=Pseudidiomarina planktonica TaxID=1323738 RepID=A0A1Y6ED00_9GAMM|nr:ferredoxin--NADP reductase [Pseudidiomarina planktonica]RUO66289.1 ferredoxin--NADP reductase [Pseudidiomarina planktonica]SMQ59091.1 ferredoxin--NADP+ reductase [Pseudidiomarina planktonica]